MSADHPVVSVVIPVLDEVDRIGACLDAVLDQDWPSRQLEVIVVDSGSRDGTAERALQVLGARPDVASSVVDNTGGGRSSNLNAGLLRAQGEVVCRVDARSIVPVGYVRRCVELLADPARAVVGGSQRTIPGGAGPQALGVARALGNQYAMGMAQYRRGGPSGPSDTVYLGAFRASQLREAGGWDDGLRVNEDFDLNQRMERFGSIWYAAELEVGYSARTSVAELARQYRGFGRWKVRYLRSSGTRARIRQLVALGVVPGALVAVLTLVLLPSRARAAVAAAGALGAVGLEHHGSAGSAPLQVRAWSLVACAAIVWSWSWGAWAELVSPEDPGRG